MKSKPTILAVDDTPSNLVALDAVLERDFEVRTAHSGAEAIAVLKAHPDVDVVVMDLQMPGMNGYEAAAAIKKLPLCADIPIVFLTAVYNEDPHVKRGYEVGGVDYFTKPFDPDLLRRKIGIYASFRQRVKLREHQLREADELLRIERKLVELVKTMCAGIIMLDRGGAIRATSDDLSRIFGLDARLDHARLAAVLGWWDSAGNLLAERAALVAAAMRGESRTAELTIKCADGTTKSAVACASPLRGPDGALDGSVVVIQDTSKPIGATAELEDHIAKLVAAQR